MPEYPAGIGPVSHGYRAGSDERGRYSWARVFDSELCDMIILYLLLCLLFQSSEVERVRMGVSECDIVESMTSTWSATLRIG